MYKYFTINNRTWYDYINGGSFILPTVISIKETIEPINLSANVFEVVDGLDPKLDHIYKNNKFYVSLEELKEDDSLE